MAPPDLERKADGAVQLGRFPVSADPEQIAAFDAALGLYASPLASPLTYPIRWLARPEVREAIRDTVGAQPVHVSQSFDYDGVVEPGADYLMDVTIQQHEAPSRSATLRSTVYGQNGEPVVALETVLYSIEAISAATPSNAPQIRKGPLPEIAIAPIDAAQVERYADASDDRSRLHCDPDFARSIGLDGPIMHGMMVMGLLQRALATWLPTAKVTRLSALFVQPVPVGSSLVIAGRIPPASRAAGRDIQVLRLFVRTDHDQLACIGEATLHIDPSTHPARP